jgi:hypothetical protein
MLQHLEFLGKGEWAEYLPAYSPLHPTDFMARLAAWIGNVRTDEDRQLLLEYARRINFFSHEDFLALYQAAFNGPITRWVVKQAGISLKDANLSALLEAELHRHTWYCPITDSMDINEFYHVNHIKGVEHRPSFATLAMLDPTKKNGQPALATKLRNFMEKPDRNRFAKARQLKRLVLLEDFVGSGNQIKAAIKWAANWLGVSILVVPLVICAPGIEALTQLTSQQNGTVSAAPVVTVSASELLGLKCNNRNRWSKRSEMEALAKRVRSRVGGEDYLGYNQTGCSVVTYSNAPNNSLPLIHSKPSSGKKWRPLFPRSSRV